MTTLRTPQRTASGRVQRAPAGYYLDFDPKNTVLTLHFTLPLKTPVKAKKLPVEVYDREFFIDFSFAEKSPAKLVGASAQCKLSVVNPEHEMSRWCNS